MSMRWRDRDESNKKIKGKIVSECQTYAKYEVSFLWVAGYVNGWLMGGFRR